MTFMDMQWESEEQHARWQTEGCPARGCGLTWFWGLPGWRWQNPGPDFARLYLHGRREEVTPWPDEPPMSEALLEVPRCGIDNFVDDPSWRTGALRLILAWVDRVHAYEEWVAGKHAQHISWSEFVSTGREQLE